METTLAKLRAAIDVRENAVWFGGFDFAEKAKISGAMLTPARLVLFGGPGPDGEVMATEPTLALDAFCQELLVWQDSHGKIKVSFNDLLALAIRQKIRRNIALRFVDRRVGNTFENALETE